MEPLLERLLEIWGSNANDTSDALRWIENTPLRQAEEGLYLDFKQKSDNRSPLPGDDDKANLAKSISGFANTDGGLIIWGVKAKSEKKEDPDVAISTHPIRGLKTFLTRLESPSRRITLPEDGNAEN